MLSDYTSSWKSQMRFAATRETARRTAQGRIALGTQSEPEMYQPQDGGVPQDGVVEQDVRSRVAGIGAKLNRAAWWIRRMRA